MSPEPILPNRGHLTWSIIRLFNQALLLYREEYAQYEDKVLAHAERQNIDRKLLRLNPKELAALLNFKNLEHLRNGCIHELKDLCHKAFRTEDQTDLLDRWVSDIFHEISILKEEHYTLKTYGPLYEKDEATVELDFIVDEAHKGFPLKLRHIDFLFGKAQKRLQVLLPAFRSMPIVIRSLYLQRDRDYVANVYPEGLFEFYRFMYPLGPFDGLYQVGASFEQAGFLPQALVAYGEALEHYEQALIDWAEYVALSSGRNGSVSKKSGGSRNGSASTAEAGSGRRESPPAEASDGGKSRGAAAAPLVGGRGVPQDPSVHQRLIESKMRRLRASIGQRPVVGLVQGGAGQRVLQPDRSGAESAPANSAGSIGPETAAKGGRPGGLPPRASAHPGTNAGA